MSICLVKYLAMANVDMEKRDLQAAATSHRGDRVFNRSITGAAFIALVVLAGIAIFLGAQAVPVFQKLGFSFLTTTAWDLTTDPPDVGILECCTARSCLPLLA